MTVGDVKLASRKTERGRDSSRELLPAARGSRPDLRQNEVQVIKL